MSKSKAIEFSLVEEKKIINCNFLNLIQNFK